MAKKRRANPEPSPQSVWRTAVSPDPMLEAAQGLLSPRRRRLFAIACCKSLFGEVNVWAGYSDLLRLAELMADSGTEQRMSALLDRGIRHRRVAYPHGVIHLINEDAGRAAAEWAHILGDTRKELAHRTEILREIAGNPLAEIHLDRALATWREGTIPKLAQACYDSNDFSGIGILGDALEEAGCSERAILEHVRCTQTHYRGCWVIDLILGKK